MSIMLITINKGYASRADNSDRIYETELTIMQSVVVNYNLKEQVLSFIPNTNPEYYYNIPIDIETKINDGTPDYLHCLKRICYLEDKCELKQADQKVEKEIYVQSLVVSDGINSRILKIFCDIK